MEVCSHFIEWYTCSYIYFPGPSAMVWGWAVGSVFILFVGMSMAELGSAAPTSGGVRLRFTDNAHSYNAHKPT